MKNAQALRELVQRHVMLIAEEAAALGYEPPEIEITVGDYTATKRGDVVGLVFPYYAGDELVPHHIELNIEKHFTSPKIR